jgi:hypothetical protein
MVLDPDDRPLLVCRVDAPPPMQKELDDWMPVHFDDFGRHDAVLSASAYRVLRDFGPGGLPAPFNNQATRFIPYVCTDIPAMHAWIGSPVVTGGLDEETLARENKYPAIADEAFSGTMMSVSQVRGRLGREVSGDGPTIAERFEVPDDRAAEFDAWLEGVHLDRYEALPGRLRVRTLKGDRTANHAFPWNRYLGKGNRLIWCEFEPGTDVKSVVRSDAYREMLADSLRWDSELTYTTRDACECMLLRDLSQIPAAA